MRTRIGIGEPGDDGAVRAEGARAEIVGIEDTD
jgi:hypothetical protein